MVDTFAGHNTRDPHDLHARVEVQLDQAAEELARRFTGEINYDVARRAVSEAYQRLSGQAKFHNFLPILAARSAQRSLATAGSDNPST